MITECSYYEGYRVFTDASKNMQFVKRDFMIAYKYVIAIEDSTNTYEEERFTCLFRLITQEVIHVVGHYERLVEELKEANKYQNL